MTSWRMQGEIFLDQGLIQSFYVGKLVVRVCERLVICLKQIFAKWCSFHFVYFYLE